MTKDMRTLITTVFVVVGSFGGALLTEAIGLNYGLPWPGLIVWNWLHPDPQPTGGGAGLSANAGSMVITWIVTDSACWFIVLMVAVFLVNRADRRKNRLG